MVREVRMRRGLTVIGTVAVTMVIAVGVTWMPHIMGNSEFFQVTEVTVEGVHYLDEGRVHDLLDLPSGASVWGDLDAWAARVRRHVLVDDAVIQRRLPHRLEVQVVERRPVALHPSPILVPVDREGRVLPVDPALHRLDLPIILPAAGRMGGGASSAGRASASNGGRAASAAGAGGAASSAPMDPVWIRLLALEVARLSEMDPGFMALVSEVEMDDAGDVILHLSEPRAAIHYRGAASPQELRRSLRLLDHARSLRSGESPTVVDLRFEDRAILRFARTEGGV